MYQYNISLYDWEEPLNVVMNVDTVCTATIIVDLCRDRDNHMIDMAMCHNASY